MGCCIAEIAMFIFGIMTLAKGSFTLSRNRVVRGAPAYVIGAILTAVLPVVLGIGFAIGFFIAAKGGNPQDMKIGPLAAVDPIVVLLALVAVLAIGLATGKEPQKRKSTSAPFAGGPTPQLRPVDPNNPYASPQTDERDRLLDEMQ